MRRATLVLLGSILTGLLFLIVFASIVNQTVGNRDTVKRWFDDSNVYGSVVAAALDAANDKDGAAGQADIPVDDPKIQKVINDALSPEFLKSNTENVIDNVFSWMKGDIAEPNFTIELGEAKGRLISGLSDYAARRAADLPACKAGAAPSRDFDAFNATCLPAGVKPTDVAAQVRQELATNGDFLPDTKIEAKEISAKDDNGEGGGSVFGKDFKLVPSAYRNAAKVPFVLGVIAALVALGIVFAAQTKRKGLRRVGTILITNGVILAVSILLLRFAGTKLKETVAANAESQSMKELVSRFANIVFNDINGLLITFAIAYAILGAIVIIVTLRLKKPAGGTPAAVPAGEPEVSPAKPTGEAEMHADVDHETYMSHLSKQPKKQPAPKAAAKAPKPRRPGGMIQG